MAKKLIELDNGLMMEVEASQDETELISGGNDMVDKVEQSMSTVETILIKSVEPIVNAYQVLNQEVTLESAEVEIGIGFSAEGNIFVVQGSANANLNVTLTLKPKE